MKKLIGCMATLLLFGGMSSCRNSLDPEEEGNYRSHRVKEKPVMKTFKLQFGGDYVSETEESLLRAEDGNIYVGLNVYRKPKDDEDTKEEMYAYGMFIGKDGLSISLLTGYTYRFEASILIDKEDRLELNGIRYNQPFMLHDATSTGFDNAWGYEVRDVQESYRPDQVFKYSSEDPQKSTWFLCQLKSGTAYVSCGGDLVGVTGATIPAAAMRHPRVKRFYGALDAFDPALLSTIEIPMEYKSFGLKFILESIPEGTSVSVADRTTYTGKTPSNDPDYYLLFPKGLSLNLDSDESATWEGIYSLNNLNTSTKEFTLRFWWDKGNGEPRETFDHTFTVTAKKKKVLKLNIDGDVNETKSGNIIFTQMDDALEEETPEVIDKDFK